MATLPSNIMSIGLCSSNSKYFIALPPFTARAFSVQAHFPACFFILKISPQSKNGKSLSPFFLFPTKHTRMYFHFCLFSTTYLPQIRTQYARLSLPAQCFHAKTKCRYIFIIIGESFSSLHNDETMYRH